MAAARDMEFQCEDSAQLVALFCLVISGLPIYVVLSWNFLSPQPALPNLPSGLSFL
jgi:hypothetical protein